jgi:hypothetical protein
MYEDRLFPCHLHSPNSIIQLNCDRLPECFAESPKTHAIPGDSIANVSSPRQGSITLLRTIGIGAVLM